MYVVYSRKVANATKLFSQKAYTYAKGVDGTLTIASTYNQTMKMSPNNISHNIGFVKSLFLIETKKYYF